MNNIDSLYTLIKQKSQEKGRKLKVVADWDEVLQPLKPLAIYKMSKKVGSNFEEFFKRFWEIAVFSYKNLNSEGKILGVNGTEEEKRVFDEYLESLKVVHDYDQGERLDREIKKIDAKIAKVQGETRRELENQKKALAKQKQEWENKIQGKKKEQGVYWKNYYRSPEWIKTITNAPFLSIAEDLLKALKEDLIEELIVISSYRKGRGKGQGVKRKTGNFPKTFGLFPQCKLELTETDKNEKGKYIPYRWEILQDKYPDFDMLIDDNNNVILQAKENLSDSKIYVLPNYASNQSVRGSNIYRVKTTISNIEDQDFAIVALEKQVEILEKEIKLEIEKKNSNHFWLIPLVVIVFLTLVSVLLFSKRKSKISSKKQK